MTPERLLVALADGGAHSGEALARDFGVTRAAVWKQIAKLADWGLVVDAVPGVGYRLDRRIDLLDAVALRAALSPEVARRLASPDVFTALDVRARRARPNADLSALPDAASRASLVRSMLAKLGNLCAIVDDVWDEASARTLMSAIPPGCPILITTRDGDLAKTLRCRVERIDALNEDEAIALLAKLLGPLDGYEPAAREIASAPDYASRTTRRLPGGLPCSTTSNKP